MKILILANHFNTLRIFRRELIIQLSEMGHDVTLSIPGCDDENKKILESYGAKVIFTEFDRRGTNPFKDISLLREYKRLVRILNPDKVISYTIKCNIYGALACKKSKIDHYANVTGLGSTFQSDGILRKLVSALYRISLKHSKRVFFENIGNRDTLVNDGIICADKAVVLNGAGVNIDEFSAAPYPSPDAPCRFLYIGRIMMEKGIDEYFDAIRKVKKVYPMTKFDFIGWYEDSYEETVKHMESEGLLKFHGFQSDVTPFIREASCIVLPSWHEGMSNTLLESAAMCRPLITSNIHGCKEAIINGVSGFLFECRNKEDLYNTLIKFIELPYPTKVNMGIEGRKYMEIHFDKFKVVEATLKEIF